MSGGLAGDVCQVAECACLAKFADVVPIEAGFEEDFEAFRWSFQASSSSRRGSTFSPFLANGAAKDMALLVRSVRPCAFERNSEMIK